MLRQFEKCANLNVEQIELRLHYIKAQRLKRDENNAIKDLNYLVRNINYAEYKNDQALIQRVLHAATCVADAFDSNQARLYCAMLLERLDQPEEALKLYFQARNQDQTNWLLYLYPAHLELERGNYAATLTHLQNMFKTQKESQQMPSSKNLSDAYDMLETVIIRQEKPQKAAKLNGTTIKHESGLADTQAADQVAEKVCTIKNTSKEVAHRVAANLAPEEIVEPRTSSGFYHNLQRIGSAFFTACISFGEAIPGAIPDELSTQPVVTSPLTEHRQLTN